MKTPQISNNNFEDRLLEQLQHSICQVAPDAKQNESHSNKIRLALISLSLVAVVALAVLIPVMTGSHSAQKAYAVSKSSNGNVTASVYKFSDSTGLESQLKSDGVSAVVNFLPSGKVCAPNSEGTPDDSVPASAVDVNLSPSDGSALAVTVDPSALQGLTLVIDAQNGSTSVPADGNSDSSSNTGLQAPNLAQGIGVLVVSGTVGHCTVVAESDPK